MSLHRNGRMTPRDCWQAQHGVRWTRHALDRWDERTPADALAPETAWRVGDEVDHPDVIRTNNGRTPDRARVYREADWGAVMLVSEHRDLDAVVTVYALDSVYDRRAREYCYSFGPHGGGE